MDLLYKYVSAEHVLTLHYKTNKGKFEFAVTTEEHSFVFRNLSTGKHSAQFGGSPEVEITSMWSKGKVC